VADASLAERISREVFFSGFAGESRQLSQDLRRVAGAVVALAIDAGETLYRQGDPAEDIFFVVSGEIKLTKAGSSDWVFGSRSLVGTLDVVLDRAHARTAIATAPAHLLRLRSVDWLDILEDSFDLTHRVLRNFAASVHVLRQRPPPLGGFDEPKNPPAETPDVVNLVDVILLLRQIPLFSLASVQTLASLAGMAEETRAAKGDILVSAPAFGERLVVLASGAVEASGAGEPTARFGRGALVCGADALGGGSYEIRAADATRAFVLQVEDYLDIMEEHFSLARSALRALALEREALLDRASPGTQDVGSRV
jgi:CRP-like cAMP-binding protein